MKYLPLTLATLTFITVFATTSGAETRQSAPVTKLSQAQPSPSEPSPSSKMTSTDIEAEAQDREVLTGLIRDIFKSMRDQDYLKLASFYSEEAQANFKHRFLKEDRINKLQQVIPEVADQLKTLTPADFISTVYTQIFDKLISSLSMPINIAYPSITNIELSNNGKEAVIGYIELGSDSGYADPNLVCGKTMGFIRIAGKWRPLESFLEETLDELIDLLLLVQSFAECYQGL